MKKQNTLPSVIRVSSLTILLSSLFSLVGNAAVDDAGMRYTSASEGFYGSIRVLFANEDKDTKKCHILCEPGDSTSVTSNSGSSRVGIRGSSDLGGGLEATYHWEIGINGDNTGSDPISGTRIATVGLEGAFGAFNFGTQWVPDYDVFGVTDVTNDLSGNFVPALRRAGVIRYDSPSLGGRFSFSAAAESESSDRRKSFSKVSSAPPIPANSSSATQADQFYQIIQLPPLLDADGGDGKEDSKIDAFSLSAKYSFKGWDFYAAYRRDIDSGFKHDQTVAILQKVDETARTAELTKQYTDQERRNLVGDGFDPPTIERRLITAAPAIARRAARDAGVEAQKYANDAKGKSADILTETKPSDVNHFGAGVGYGQDNWSVNYLYMQGDRPLDAKQNYKVHSLAGQIAVEKLTFRAVFETEKTGHRINVFTRGPAPADPTEPLDSVTYRKATKDFDRTIWVLEAQYDLGSRSRVWAAIRTDDNENFYRGSEVTTFHIGHRVDF